MAAHYPEDLRYMPHELRAEHDPAFRDRPLPVAARRADYYRLEALKAKARRAKDLPAFRYYAKHAREALAELP